MIGSKLGHFEIQAMLGEGGMGAVYRARDLTLGRTVAVKVLPAKMIADPDRKVRFLHEAKAASSLQHPNIVTIHEIGAQDGVDFMAMELVEGKTLSLLIPRGGMSPAKALPIARQIADGLAKAHAAGIIHRDLKPSNVMVTPDGHVKILDFGLAKLAPGPISQDDVTVTNFRTEAGMILGTVAYMSPEQAEGRALDARSDIFSFGSLLYEMLTGERAFQRETPTGTLAAVLRDSPDMKLVPANLSGMVERCLQKDADRRFQTMASVRAALRDTGEKSAARLPGWLAPATAAAALAAAGVWWWQSQDRLPPMSITPLTSDPGFETSPTFSPDGTQVAYTWDGGKPGRDSQIYVKIVGSPTALRLTNNPGYATLPSWSPDGKFIAYRAVRDGKMGVYLISPLGGPERRLGGEPGSGQLSWSPDGRYVVLAGSALGGGSPQPAEAASNSIRLLPIEGGVAEIVLRPEAGMFYRAPDIHPSGRWLAYLDCGQSGCHVRVSSLRADLSPGTDRRTLSVLSSGVYSLRWNPYSEAVLWAAHVGQVPYLYRAGLTGGEPSRLELAGAQADGFAAARRGNRAAFERRTVNFDVWAMDERGSVRALLTSNLPDASARFSPDGRKVAFAAQRGGDAQQIWLANSDGSEATPLTSGPATKGSPSWSPDGKWIAFDSQDPATGIWQIWVMGSGGEPARQLTKMPGGAVAPSWSRDGKYIYAAVEFNGRPEVFRVAAGDGSAVKVTGSGGAVAQESRDGMTLYYTKRLGTITSLHSMPVSGGAETKVLDSLFFRSFDLFDDGLYYLFESADGQIEARFHSFAGRADRAIGAVRGEVLPYLSVSPDRKTILFSYSPQSGSDLMLIENFR